MKSIDSKTKTLLKMLREAHGAIMSELHAAGDDDHPIYKTKREMLERHDAALKKMGLDSVR